MDAEWVIFTFLMISDVEYHLMCLLAISIWKLSILIRGLFLAMLHGLWDFGSLTRG